MVLGDLGRALDRKLKELPLTPVDFARKLKDRESKRKQTTGPKQRQVQRFTDDRVRFTPTEPFKPVSKPTTSSSPAKQPTTMDSNEALRTVINDPAIKITPAVMDLVNDDALVVLPSGEIAQRLGSQSASLGPRQEKKKTKGSKYTRTYRRVFRQLAPRYKMKNGKWKKNGFKTAVRAAHKETRKILGL